MALKSGLTITDSYRSVPGIVNRLVSMECVINGMSRANVQISGLFARTADMYKNDKTQYEHLLSEARKMIGKPTSGIDKFIQWVSQTAPEKKTSWIESNLLRAEALGNARKLIDGSIFDVADAYSLSKLRAEMKTNRIFKLSCGKVYKCVVEDFELYCRYCAEMETRSNEQPNREDASAVSKYVFTLDNIPNLAYSKPISFVLENAERKTVDTWAKLFAAVLEQLGRERMAVLREQYKDFFTSPLGLRRPYELSSGIYIECNASSADLVKRLKKFFETCCVPLNSLRIEFEYIKDEHKEGKRLKKQNDDPNEILRDAIIKGYPGGLRFDDTILCLLSEETGIKITRTKVDSLKKQMYKRADELFFLPEMIVPRDIIESIKTEIRAMLKHYAVCEVGVLYKDFQTAYTSELLRDAEDYADFLEYLLPDAIRVANAYGTKIIRSIGVTVNEATNQLAQLLLQTIKESGCVTEDDLIQVYPVVSGAFIRKLMEKNTDEVVATTINDILCYQTIDAIGLDDSFSEMLNEVLERVDKLTLLPTQETIHVLLSVEIGQNFRDAYGISDDKTFRRIISMYYSGEKARMWKAGQFMEEQTDDVRL